MRAKTNIEVYGKKRDRYLELIHRFPLRPIRNDSELDAAIDVINSLIDRDRLDPAENDYLDVITDLVEAYEDVAIPMGPVGEARMLRYLLENRGETQTDLARKTGISASTISEVISGKRTLTREQVAKLSRYFKIDPRAFDPI